MHRIPVPQVQHSSAQAPTLLREICWQHAKLRAFWAPELLSFEGKFRCRPMFSPIKLVRKGVRDYINFQN